MARTIIRCLVKSHGRPAQSQPCSPVTLDFTPLL